MGEQMQVCKRCKQKVIAPGRKHKLCLDCLIEIIAGDDSTNIEVFKYV